VYIRNSVAYDANGNALGCGYSYDVETRLVGAPGEDYAYDVNNRRVWKRRQIGEPSIGSRCSSTG
jgi:hypothetical protein